MCRMVLHGLRPEPADALRAEGRGVDPEALALDRGEGGLVLDDGALAHSGPVDDDGARAGHHDAVVEGLLPDQRLDEARVG
jgi:hypothetical protein